MRDLKTLLAEKAQLEAEIRAQKPAAIAQVRELMEQLGVSLADLGGVAAARGAPATKRPVKYRDGSNTWTGVGQRPRWLAAKLRQGHTIEDFRVK